MCAVGILFLFLSFSQSKNKAYYVTKFVMPSLMRLCAACKRPSRVRNAAHRAEPMTVPLFKIKRKKIVEKYEVFSTDDKARIVQRRIMRER